MDPEVRRRLQEARRLTSGLLFVDISWQAIGGLALRVAQDRAYDLEERFGRRDIPEFFEVVDPADWEQPDIDSREAVDWLLQKDQQNAVYLELLIRLFARRIKYRRILNTQAFPTSDQVGPRMLLEHGLLDAGALRSLVVWRKWMMDIDNRAGQETGYLYDAIVARALGGTSYGAHKSPILRKPEKPGGRSPGRRQVDCIVEDGENYFAYEVKIRITDAASRQGRLKEELSFPADCAFSKHVPRLLVFDPTPCETLQLVVTAFEEHGGQVFLGGDAYTHVGATAGPAQAEFLRRYVAEPLERYEDALPEFGAGRALADLHLAATPNTITISLDGFDPYVLPRDADPRTVLDDTSPPEENSE